MKERPNADVIRAYADGKDVEWKGLGDCWIEYAGAFPIGDPNHQWRVKPEPAKILFRVALMKDDVGYFLHAYQSAQGIENALANGRFVRWVTEPETVEVGE